MKYPKSTKITTLLLKSLVLNVEVSIIWKWLHSNKTIENTKGGANKTTNKEDEEEDPDSQEEEDDDPDFGSVPGKNSRMKHVKEFPDDIKEAAVEHKWTAAVAKYGASST